MFFVMKEGGGEMKQVVKAVRNSFSMRQLYRPTMKGKESVKL